MTRAPSGKVHAQEENVTPSAVRQVHPDGRDLTQNREGLIGRLTRQQFRSNPKGRVLWMFRAAHPEDAPLRIRPELLTRQAPDQPFPILRESTPVRMGLTHSGWSDIFFLGMDFPEGARATSIDLSARLWPSEAARRSLAEGDRPASAAPGERRSAKRRPISSISRVLRSAIVACYESAVIASGLVPPGGTRQPLSELLAAFTGRSGHGIEIVSKVNDIPRGSRLAVSTNLLASIISLCIVLQTRSARSRAVWRTGAWWRLGPGEWLGGSGGGCTVGGVWPGIKLIHGVRAQEGDPEFGVSRGHLCPAPDL